MNRREELWNDKEITSTLTVPGTIRTAVGRDIWSKILGENQCEETCIVTNVSDKAKRCTCSAELFPLNLLCLQYNNNVIYSYRKLVQLLKQ